MNVCWEKWDRVQLAIVFSMGITICLFVGVAKRDAQVLFVMIMYELENYGMTYVQAIVNGERVRVAIGAKCIRILTQNWRCKTR